MKHLYGIVLGLSLAALPHGEAAATLINSSADPLLAGASLITFDEVPVATTDPVINGVSFTGDGFAVFTIASAFPGQTSPVLGNTAAPVGTFVGNGVSFDIVFSLAVSAFSLDIAAVAANSTSMEAYSKAGVLLDSVALPQDNANAATWGFGDIGLISRVRFVSTDFFFSDNLRYVAAVPEPATAAIMLLGIAGLGRRRRLN